MLIHMLSHITLAITPGGCSKKMLFTLFFNVLSHALTQLFVIILSMSKWFVSQVHMFLSFFYC